MPGLHQGPTSYAVDGVPPVPNANAWGNAPGDNTLMGCNAIYKHREFTEFILEADVSSFDNDGVGFNFGVRGNMCGAPGSPSCAGVANSRYTAIMINDRWPSPAADGVGGPHFKIKMQNGRDCTANMDATNNCFDTLAYLNNEGHFQATEATAASGNAATDRVEAPLPPSYAQTYQAYPRNVHLTLIVKDLEARAFWHDSTMSIVNAVKAKLPASYVGGKVGLFTYAHTGWFSNLKITDIGATAESMPTDYCNEKRENRYVKIGTCTPGTGLCAQLPPMPPSPPPLPPTSPPSPKLPSPPPPSSSSPDELDAGSSAIKAGSDGLDTGAIAGIAVGGGVLVAAVVIVGFFCFRESRRKGASASLAKATPVEMQVSATGDAPAQVEMEGKA